MIKPTVGRRVLFWPNGYSGVKSLDPQQPMAAVISFVKNNRYVNLSVTDHAGNVLAVPGVLLLQGDETYNPIGWYCEWPREPAHITGFDVVYP